MAKRTATTELNHENWNEDDTPEEAGTFQEATDEVLKKREIKKARRPGASVPDGGGMKSGFSGFTGFSGFGGTKPAGATFSFLNSTALKSGSTNGTTDSSAASIRDQAQLPSLEKSRDTSASTGSCKRDSEYYRYLKTLNENVTSWIKQHVDSNPYCFLTPVFKDYEKYLTELERKFPQDGQKITKGTKLSSDTVNSDVGFSFKKESGFSLERSRESASKNTEKDSSNRPAFVTKSPYDSKSAIGTPFSFGLKKGSDSESKTSVTFGEAGKEAKSDNSATGFSFGSGKPFTFAHVTSNTDEKQSDKSEDDNEEPPKNEFTKVQEDDAVYSKKCKLFFKKDENYVEKGLGMLYLKPVGEKMQLLIRADTSLGNILLNLILNSSIPTQRVGKNNVMIACIPNPPIDAKAGSNTPVPMLIRVKTAEAADELLEKLNEYKK